MVAAYATCTGLPLYRRRIQGHSRSQDLLYSTTAGDEVEDLFLLLAYVKVCVVAVTMCSAARACRTQQHLQHSTGGSAAMKGVDVRAAYASRYQLAVPLCTAHCSTDHYHHLTLIEGL